MKPVIQRDPLQNPHCQQKADNHDKVCKNIYCNCRASWAHLSSLLFANIFAVAVVSLCAVWGGLRLWPGGCWLHRDGRDEPHTGRTVGECSWMFSSNSNVRCGGFFFYAIWPVTVCWTTEVTIVWPESFWSRPVTHVYTAEANHHLDAIFILISYLLQFVKEIVMMWS